MSETIIKGEVHASKGDFQEARDLLAEGVDTLVIEGSGEEEADFGWRHSWLGVAMMIFDYLFASFLYTDKQTLTDIAEGQGAEVVPTRETDVALIENSHKLVVGIACVLFYLLFLASALIGIVLNNQIAGAGVLLLAGLVPIIILRVYETRKSGENRDKKIAEKIKEATEDSGRVVAVMGNSHAKKVPDHLPDDIELEVKEPKYGFFSFQMMRDIFVALIQMIGMMAVVYPVFLAVFELYLALL